MRPFRSNSPTVVTRTYGRGSLLGFLAPLFAYVMAAAGMRGWEESARRAMEDDVMAMARRGYRVRSADEYRMPLLGIVFFKVTYEPSATQAGTRA